MVNCREEETSETFDKKDKKTLKWNERTIQELMTNQGVTQGCSL